MVDDDLMSEENVKAKNNFVVKSALKIFEIDIKNYQIILSLSVGFFYIQFKKINKYSYIF
jgi:hypothetical protein